MFPLPQLDAKPDLKRPFRSAAQTSSFSKSVLAKDFVFFSFSCFPFLSDRRFSWFNVVTLSRWLFSVPHPRSQPRVYGLTRPPLAVYFSDLVRSTFFLFSADGQAKLVSVSTRYIIVFLYFFVFLFLDLSDV